MIRLILVLSLLESAMAQVQLPTRAKEALDIALTVKWQLSKGFFHECDLNGDTLPDYAMKVVVGENKYTVEYYVALIADADGYGFYLLGSTPAWLGLGGESVNLRHKGEEIPNFENFNYEKDEPGKIKLQADALEFVPEIGCCSTIFIFKNGRFHLITTSD